MSSAEKPAKRGRKPREAQPVEIINEAAFEQDAQALTVVTTQAAEVLKKIGYDEPYDRERTVSETGFYLKQAGDAALEVGRRLIVLKENEPHGTFTEIIENRLRLSARFARMMMQAAAKYLLNPALEAKRQSIAVLGTTKLFDLMAEPDEDLAALADGGTLAGHTLDEIERMSTRELRAALREAREESATKDKLLDDKNKKIDRLNAEKKRLKELPPDVEQEEMLKEMMTHHNTIQAQLRGTYRWDFKTILEHAQKSGIDCREVLAGCLGQLKRTVLEIQEEFALPDHVGDGTPEWKKWAAEQGLTEE